MKLRPLHNRVFLRRIEKNGETATGLVIPDTAREKSMVGRVLSVGPGRMMEDGRRSAMDIKAGDRVLFKRLGGIEVTLDTRNYLILQEEEILAVLTRVRKADPRTPPLPRTGSQK